MMPLLPGFEGDIQKANSAVMKLQLELEYRTISRSENSLFKQLEKCQINPDEYIQILGLRTHSFFNQQPHTE